MKKAIILMVSLFFGTVASHAMSYEQARDQALFLADKMAYELNLTEEQYEACYEINLDYFMNINSEDDLYGIYWDNRNYDLGCILYDWQYQYFLDAMYFWRPFYVLDGLWHFAIYSRYPYRNYFYFGRPAFFDTYRGGHAWHKNGGKSWYAGRPNTGKGTGITNRKDNNQSGMRDKFNKGDFGRGQNIDSKNNGSRIGNNGQSSTRLTAGNTKPTTTDSKRNTASTGNISSTAKPSSSNRSSVNTQKSGSTFNNTTTKQSTSQPSTTSRIMNGTTAKGTTSVTKSSSTPRSTTSTVSSSKSTSTTKSSSSARSSSSSVRSSSASSSVKSSSTPSRSSSSSVRSSSSATKSSPSVSRSSSSSSRSAASSSRSSSSSASRSSGASRSGASGGSKGGGGRR